MKKPLLATLLLLCFALICGCAEGGANESSAEGSKKEESSLPILISRAESSAPSEISLPEEESSTEEISLPIDDSSHEESEEEMVYTDIGDAEFIPSGYLLYNGAAYSHTYHNPVNAQRNPTVATTAATYRNDGPTPSDQT